MVKLLRVLVCALLTVAALVAAAPRASAAPPPVPYAGTAQGDVVELDLDVGAIDLADARIADSLADTSSTDDPRSLSRSRNLAAPVAGLPIELEENSQTAPPDNDDPETGEFVAAEALGIGTGTITFSNLARWVGDASCVIDGPLSDTTTSTTGVTVSPVGAVDLFDTGDVSVRTTNTLVPAASTFNRGVQSVAVGTTSGSTLFGGLVTVAVTGDPSLTALAPGTPGGAAVTYDDPEVEVTFAGDTTPIPLGGSLDIDLGVTGAVTISVNPPTVTVDPDGTSASGSVNVITYAVRIGPEIAPLGTATINQLPLSVSAVAPAGGIDCPPPAPVVATPADGAVVTDLTPTFSGTGVEGATIDLVLDGETIEDAATVGAGGTWTFTPTESLPQGEYTVSAFQTLNGARSPESNENEFVIDLAAGTPDAPVITAPDDGSTITDPTPDITGTGEPGATVTVEIDGDEVGETVVDDDGTWELALTEPLDDGEHTVTATQTDGAGNESEADEVTFAVDTEALPPVITDPADGSSTNDTTPTIRGTAEPGASVAIEVDGTPVGTVTADEDGNFSLELTDPLAEGDHTVSAVQTDLVGNVSEPGESDFTVDLTAPAAPVITAPEDGATVTDRTPTIEGTGEPGTTIVVAVDGEPVGSAVVDEDGNWSLTLPNPLSDGEHTIAAIAVDAAGNESGVDAITITIDGEIQQPADGPELADTGGPSLGYAIAGGVLLVVGGTVLSLTRRRA